MDLHSLQALYRQGLQELSSSQAQFAEASPKMTVATASAQLREVIERHAAQTLMHKGRIEAFMQRHGKSHQKHADPVAVALLRKMDTLATLVGDPDLLDAALTTSLRCIKHHEIAAYAALLGYARALSFEIDRHILQVILDEKRAADRELEDLESGINQLALLVSTPAYV